MVERRGAVLAVILLAAGLLASCSTGLSGDAVPEAPPAARPSESGPRSVRVVRPEPVAADEGLHSHLYVERDVRVAARRSGVIEKVLADRGDRVRAGDLLALLETDIASREVDLAEAAVRLAQAEFDRIRSLHDQSVVSPHEYLRIEVALDEAKSRAALARAWLERCSVRAPFDGVVVERWAVAGQRVVEEDGTPLFRVAAREPMRARVDVPEETLDGVRSGAGAVVRPAGGPDRPARIVFVGPAADPGSGTVPVIVETDPADGPFLLGASVMVRLGGGGAAGAAFGIPREAVLGAEPREGGDAEVFVVAGGRAESRRIHVVGRRAGALLVTGPLAASDLLIIGAAPGLAAGDAVAAQEAVR